MSGQSLLVFLCRHFPSVGFTFGYIGSVGVDYDSRSWKFFTRIVKSPNGVQHYSPSISVSGNQLSGPEVVRVIRHAYTISGQQPTPSVSTLMSLLAS